MTEEQEPITRRLIVGEQTEAVEPGATILLKDASDKIEKILTVEGVEEGRGLHLYVEDLITGHTYRALMPEGTAVIIQDPE